MTLQPLASRAADREPSHDVQSRPAFLVRAEETNGQFSLAEGVLHRGHMPPPHIHHNEDESFYVLEGELTIRVGEYSYRATSGTIVFMPRDIPHGITVETEQARVLNLLTPGTLQGFLEEVARLVHDPVAFQAKRQELMAQYGIEDVQPRG